MPIVLRDGLEPGQRIALMVEFYMITIGELINYPKRTVPGKQASTAGLCYYTANISGT